MDNDIYSQRGRMSQISPDGLASIKQEIQNDPVRMGYAQANQDNPIFGITLLVNDTTKRPGPSNNVRSRSEIKRAILRLGKLLPIFSDTTHASCQMAKFFLSDTDFPTVDLNSDEFVYIVNALLNDGMITASDITSVMALGNSTMSRAQELGYGDWDYDSVVQALAM